MVPPSQGTAIWRFSVNRALANYWVDVAIGIAGVVSALSGLVFLLPGDATAGFMGVSYQAWSSVHTWSSLAVLAGVSAHLALHGKWMVSMTRRILVPAGQLAVPALGASQAAASAAEVGPSHASVASPGRRAFLLLGGAATVATALVVAGYKAIFDASEADASPGASQSVAGSNSLLAAAQESGVACPFGVVHDPYPGRCRFYRDADGDGICDYSVPGSGDNLSTGGEDGFGGGFSRRRHGFTQP